MKLTRNKITIVGSGNWGSVIAKIAGTNVVSRSDFEPTVNMWVYEELLPNGAKLSEEINRTHVNEKYLPGVTLPRNVVAVPDVVEACRGSTHLVFVIPHQFLERTCRTIQSSGVVDVGRAKAISLIKGITFDPTKGPVLLSRHISEMFGGIPCAVLMGANVANEVAQGEFSEATIGVTDLEEGADWMALFHDPRSFRCRVVEEVAGIEICGALKNIVALAAGVSDGLGCGGNTKAALMRIGFNEMRRFVSCFFPNSNEEIYWESCGIADLITTCIGGRNRKCAEIFARERRPLKDIEKEQMNGQQLQGPGTLEEVVVCLRNRDMARDFPLFFRLYEIFFKNEDPRKIFEI